VRSSSLCLRPWAGQRCIVHVRRTADFPSRAISPTESVGSASVFTGKPTQPQTARQLAAAANKARKVEREDDSDDDDRDELRRMPHSQLSQINDFAGMERKDGPFGPDIRSREGSNLGGWSANATPTMMSTAVMADKPRSNRGKEIYRRGQEDEEDDESEGEEEAKPMAKRNVSTSHKKVTQHQQHQPQPYDIEMSGGGGPEAGEGGGEDVDSRVYCTCRQLGYGEMIGCDDDECEIEWVSCPFMVATRVADGNSTTCCASTSTRPPRGSGSAPRV